MACVQTRAHDRDAFASRLAQILALIELGASKAQLVVVAEGTVPAYVIGTAPVEEQQLERARSAVAAIALRYGATIVYGTARIEGGHTFNSAVVIGPDGVKLGHADKQFLWHFDRRWFAAGNRMEPITTPLGRLGVLVRADGRIPTIAATLVDRGAELLVMPTAWVTSGRDPAVLENVQADLMAAVRAAENGVPFVAANKCGVEAKSVAYCGKSLIVDREGTVVARASDREETVLFGEIEIGAPVRARSSLLATPERLARDARARIAITPSDDPHEIDALAYQAALADAGLLIARAQPSAPATIDVLDITSGLTEPAMRRAGALDIGW
ncbi:MAG TPA: carbon-nitrogen hydrolase family protein [Candidatus Baltobacteraceae bacterium]